MGVSVSHQLFVVVCMFLCGGVAGVVFDVFRGFRRRVKSGNGIIAMQDLMLWFAELAIVYYTVFKVNNAKIRGYEAVALICGALIYFLTLSQYTIKIVDKLTSVVIKIISSILLPARKLMEFIAKPIKKLGIWAKKQMFFVCEKTERIKTSALRKIKAVLRIKKHKK